MPPSVHSICRRTVVGVAAAAAWLIAGPAVAGERWQQVQQARSDFVESHIGAIPERKHTLDHLSSFWPGGGFYEIEATRLGSDTWAYITFGLTNPDMPPASLTFDVNAEAPGGVVNSLRKQFVPPPAKAKAGFGYELMILTDEAAQWPLRLLEWAVNQELLGQADLLTEVAERGGMTVADIRISDTDYASVLIAKARHFPNTVTLPNGTMQWLVATVITDDELAFVEQRGADVLLDKLLRHGIAQRSELERASILHPEPIDYSKISSRAEALELHQKGLLRKVYLFPPEFGGEEEDLNAVYLPREAALKKKMIDERVLRLARQGRITNYGASPQYIGSSFIPNAIEIRALGTDGFEERILSWEEKPFKVPSADDIYRLIREQETENR